MRRGNITPSISRGGGKKRRQTIRRKKMDDANPEPKGNNRSVARKTDYSQTLDFVSTPECATKALLEREAFWGGIHEPACGDGRMAKVLVQEYNVTASDITNRGYGGIKDYLEDDTPYDNIVTNPPYALVNQFWVHACSNTKGKVAFLCKIQFLEGKKRREMFSKYPPSRIYVFSSRVPFGEENSSNMFCHAWFVRDPHHNGDPIIKWI